METMTTTISFWITTLILLLLIIVAHYWSKDYKNSFIYNLQAIIFLWLLIETIFFIIIIINTGIVGIIMRIFV